MSDIDPRSVEAMKETILLGQMCEQVSCEYDVSVGHRNVPTPRDVCASYY